MIRQEDITLAFIEVIFTYGFIRLVLVVWTPLIVALLIRAVLIKLKCI